MKYLISGQCIKRRFSPLKVKLSLTLQMKCQLLCQVQLLLKRKLNVCCIKGGIRMKGFNEAVRWVAKGLTTWDLVYMEQQLVDIGQG